MRCGPAADGFTKGRNVGFTFDSDHENIGGFSERGGGSGALISTSIPESLQPYCESPIRYSSM